MDEWVDGLMGGGWMDDGWWGVDGLMGGVGG